MNVSLRNGSELTAPPFQIKTHLGGILAFKTTQLYVENSSKIVMDGKGITLSRILLSDIFVATFDESKNNHYVIMSLSETFRPEAVYLRHCNVMP